MTITKEFIIRKLSEEMDCTLVEASCYVEAILAEVSAVLMNHEDVLISGFGKFMVVKKLERMGHNPQTLEPIQLRSQSSVAFRTSTRFKKRLNAEPKELPGEGGLGAEGADGGGADGQAAAAAGDAAPGSVVTALRQKGRKLRRSKPASAKAKKPPKKPAKAGKKKRAPARGKNAAQPAVSQAEGGGSAPERQGKPLEGAAPEPKGAEPRNAGQGEAP
jgi:integration host factor subunit alpha